VTGRRRQLCALAVAAVLSGSALGCSSDPSPGSSTTPASTPASTGTITTSASTATSSLPGTGKPQITLGDKNFTEQFVLGELYKQALEAQGYDVFLNRNIGPTEVSLPAVESGRVDIYPEYLDTWDRTVAAVRRPFGSPLGAYRAGQQYALAHGLQLLNATPFTDTQAIAVTRAYATKYRLRELGDLRKVGAMLTLGGPPQFQQDPAGLPAIELAYGFTPATFSPVGVGAQYQALDQGTVQAAEVNTTDGQLTSGRYVLLRDPQRVFGWGNVVPIVSAPALLAEGPAFTATVDRVDATLSTRVMRRLNASVDLAHQDPAAVAKQFLQSRGLVASG
jgi:osmoprotectant transport system substrate-binding protein